jgi:hypothetical protein
MDFSARKGLRKNACAILLAFGLVLAASCTAALAAGGSGHGKRMTVDDAIRAPRIHAREKKKQGKPSKSRHSHKHGGRKTSPGTSTPPSSGSPSSGESPSTPPTKKPTESTTNPPAKKPTEGKTTTPTKPPATNPTKPTEPTTPTEPTPETPAPPTPPSTPPPAACTTTVSTVAAAQTAVSNGAVGAVVCLADGNYGKVSLNATKAGAGVTLRAANPAGATIAGASLAGAGLELAYFNVNGEVTVQAGAKRMTIQRNKITGGYMGITACNSTSTSCDDVKIIGNKLQGPFGEDGIRANRYHDGDGDGVGLLVEGNEFTGIVENGNHSDCLQAVWTGDNIVYRKNYVHDNHCQGFFIKDQGSPNGNCSGGNVCGPVNGILVEDNLFVRNGEKCVNAGCGPSVPVQIFGPYTRMKVTRNTIWGEGNGSVMVLQEGVAADTRIENNVIYRFSAGEGAQVPAGTFANNTYCSVDSFSGGTWPSSRPGTINNCGATAPQPADRGIDWDPAAQHYGP